ncbi:MAG: ASPIC/UnbV domain-containing protein, partial [Planctomycetes bacterium]|nr:ASPIC/UnbV domain-containing protein [Planctomycetota bacterium]
GNPRGYGAKVELVSPRANQRRWITGGGSFQSVDAPTAYFGIGEAEVEKELSVRVIFADGKTSEQRIDRPNQNVIMEYKGAAAGK